MNHDHVTGMLKNYRSYRYAVHNGVAPWDRYDSLGMPMNGEFGSRVPKRWTGSGDTTFSEWDYRRYKEAIRIVEGAINDVLNDNHRTVIMRKYVDRNAKTLAGIAIDMQVDERTIRRWHKEAIKQLTNALMFAELPEIINLDDVLDKMSAL